MHAIADSRRPHCRPVRTQERQRSSRHCADVLPSLTRFVLLFCHLGQPARQKVSAAERRHTTPCVLYARLALPGGTVCWVPHALGAQHRPVTQSREVERVGTRSPPREIHRALLLMTSPPAHNAGLPVGASYTFARGTIQPPPIGSAQDCTDLDNLLIDPRRFAEAIDVCFDAQFSCSHAEPFVGEAMIKGSSGGNPAMIQIKDSNNWLPALVPVHAPRGSRRTTKDFVPVVGCLVDNKSRFVLSWADIRCRPTTDASFPAQCDGASQHNVTIEDTAAAVSFEATTRQSARRKLDLLDTESTHVKGKKTALMLILSPMDFENPADAWTSNNPKGSDPTGHWLDPMFSDPTQCVETAVRERSPSPLRPAPPPD